MHKFSSCLLSLVLVKKEAAFTFLFLDAEFSFEATLINMVKCLLHFLAGNSDVSVSGIDSNIIGEEALGCVF